MSEIYYKKGELTASELCYNQGKPEHKGVYACRVQSNMVRGMFDDIFLIFDGRQWVYPSSPLAYRGPVPWWIGPLQRKMQS